MRPPGGADCGERERIAGIGVGAWPGGSRAAFTRTCVRSRAAGGVGEHVVATSIAASAFGLSR